MSTQMHSVNGRSIESTIVKAKVQTDPNFVAFKVSAVELDEAGKPAALSRIPIRAEESLSVPNAKLAGLPEYIAEKRARVVALCAAKRTELEALAALGIPDEQ